MHVKKSILKQLKIIYIRTTVLKSVVFTECVIKIEVTYRSLKFLFLTKVRLETKILMPFRSLSSKRASQFPRCANRFGCEISTEICVR